MITPQTFGYLVSSVIMKKAYRQCKELIVSDVYIIMSHGIQPTLMDVKHLVSNLNLFPLKR